VDRNVETVDLTLDLPGRALAARLYRPPAPAGVLPALVWYHGGGFVLCDLDSADQICSDLAVRTDALVVSIGYRLAPEHPWPAAHQDAVDSVDWLVRHAGDLSLDAGRIAVAGDSAGATLAAAAAVASASRELGLVAQVLFYPVVSASMDSASYWHFAAGFGLERDEMEWFLGHYGVLGGAGAVGFDRVLATPDASMPPMFLVSCECDVLRDEGEGYAALAADAGVEVVAARYLGMPHGFVQMTAVTPQADAALDAASRFLRDVFARGR